MYFSIEKKQKPVERPLVKPKDEDIFIKPVSSIKKEKHSQKVPEVKSHKNESEMPSTSSKKKNYDNPLLASEPEQYEEEEEEEDIMPKPFVIKQEQEIVEITKKYTIKERFNIDCDECEKVNDILVYIFKFLYILFLSCLVFWVRM